VKATVQRIESQIREYATEFLQSEYGEQALEKLAQISITAVDAYDDGGVSEATESEVKLAAKRDIDAGHLTDTTKLILRHELGHILDESQRDFPEFGEEIVHEKIAWDNAKPKTAAEKWYRNLSIRTHLDPLKMMAVGFPRPETKVPLRQLRQGTRCEIARMQKNSAFVDKVLAERYAMANLIENQNYYNQAQ
jgi:hypothetical protein